MKRISSLFAVFLFASVFLVPVSVLAGGCEPMVTIEKNTYCSKPYDPDGDTFGSNYPYYTGIKYWWWINITVHAEMDLSDYEVVVYDRLGGEFMIEGICIDTPKQPDDLYGYPGTYPAVTEPFDYTFVYNGGNPYEPERDGVVDVDGETGYVNKTGVAFDDFDIYWTGNSCKAHFQWNIGSMDEGETRTIFLVISTDKNPAGHQEFTSPGITYLNSGATVKVLTERRPGRWTPVYSASTAPIEIEVMED